MLDDQLPCFDTFRAEIFAALAILSESGMREQWEVIQLMPAGDLFLMIFTM